VAISHYTKRETIEKLGVEATRIHVCRPGAPSWRSLGSRPTCRPAAMYCSSAPWSRARTWAGSSMRTNCCSAARRTRRRSCSPAAPRPTPDHGWRRLRNPPLLGHVEHRGYVPHDDREALYAGARAVVLPIPGRGFRVARARGDVGGGAGGSVGPRGLAGGGRRRRLPRRCRRRAGLASALARLIGDDAWQPRARWRGWHARAPSAGASRRTSCGGPTHTHSRGAHGARRSRQRRVRLRSTHGSSPGSPPASAAICQSCCASGGNCPPRRPTSSSSAAPMGSWRRMPFRRGPPSSPRLQRHAMGAARPPPARAARASGRAVRARLQWAALVPGANGADRARRVVCGTPSGSPGVRARGGAASPGSREHRPPGC
jgi:hypothetical protein